MAEEKRELNRQMESQKSKLQSMALKLFQERTTMFRNPCVVDCNECFEAPWTLRAMLQRQQDQLEQQMEIGGRVSFSRRFFSI